jgi:hypothetical protein
MGPKVTEELAARDFRNIFCPEDGSSAFLHNGDTN